MKSPLRLSIEAALRKGLLESRLAKQLQAKTSKSYFDPNTGENLNYAGLMERCITDPDTGLLFLEVEVTESTKSKSESSIKSIKTKFQKTPTNTEQSSAVIRLIREAGG